MPVEGDPDWLQGFGVEILLPGLRHAGQANEAIAVVGREFPPDVAVENAILERSLFAKIGSERDSTQALRKLETGELEQRRRDVDVMHRVAAAAGSQPGRPQDHRDVGQLRRGSKSVFEVVLAFTEALAVVRTEQHQLLSAIAV